MEPPRSLSGSPSIVSRRTAIAFGLGLAGTVTASRSRVLAQATPSAVVPEAVVTELAFHSLVFPAGTVSALAVIYAIRAGFRGDYPGFDVDAPTAAVLWVVSGTMAVSGEVTAVHRGSQDDRATPTVAGDVVLGSGDVVALAFGSGQSYVIEDLGVDPLVVVEVWVVSGPLSTGSASTADYDMLYYHTLENIEELPSPAIVAIQLGWARLEHGETLEPAGGAWHLVLFDASVVSRAPENVTIKNIGGAPATVYLATASFSPVEAVPAATPSS